MSGIGVLSPGEMGAAIGGALVSAGHEVMWASSGRSEATATRAREAGMLDVETLRRLLDRCSLVISICPPQSALDLAAEIDGFDGVFLEANAIAPATASEIAVRLHALGARYLDGAVVGPPPRRAGTTRLFLSGEDAVAVAGLFSGTPLEAIALDGSPTAASALKMAYAGWTKGTLALVLAVRALARAHDVEAALLAEWERSQPGLTERSEVAAEQASHKGWRWHAEMLEVAGSMAGAGLPPGFHEAAARIYGSVPRSHLAGESRRVEAVLDLLGSASARRTTGAERRRQTPSEHTHT